MGRLHIKTIIPSIQLDKGIKKNIQKIKLRNISHALESLQLHSVSKIPQPQKSVAIARVKKYLIFSQKYFVNQVVKDQNIN